MPLGVAVIGCGLIGARRAREAAQHPSTRVELLVDVTRDRAERLSREYGGRAETDWKHALDDFRTNVVVISTPNGYAAEIAVAALAAGKHVLVEKPPGRNLAEARLLADVARQAGRVCKVGFNHRYHPSLLRAHRLLTGGVIGKVINLRARYGHGGRPGYENEWRGNPDLAGGGELTDQGVHVVDLFHWFHGLPADAFAFLQTAVWPIRPLEDNAFGLFRYVDGAVASLHTTWTQWKNLFSFEVFGERGSLVIQGLGGSYGEEQLITATRNPAGGAPAIAEELFGGPDLSWKIEWNEFIGAVTDGASYWGTPEDGVAAMAMIDALYRSARSGAMVHVGIGKL